MDRTKLRNKKLLGYALKAWPSLLLGFVLALIAMAADLVGPYLIGRLLDAELIPGLGPRDPEMYVILLAIYFISLVLAAGFSYGYNYFFNRTANRVAMMMQKDVFAHVQNLPISFFDRMASGQIVSRITTDTKDVKELFRLVLSQIVIALIYALGIYITLAYLDPRLFILGLVPLPAIIFITNDFKNKAKKYNYSQRRTLAQFNADLKEDIEGMEVIQAYTEEEFIYEELDELNMGIYEDGLAYTNVYSYSGTNAMKTTQNLTLAIGLLVIGYGALRGRIDGGIGLFYTFANYIMQLFGQMRIVVLRAGELEKSISAADHISEILAIEPREYGTLPGRVKEGRVSFEDVSFAYDGSNYVLKDINFDLAPGKQMALVGHTGSGKSSIMNLLFGFYQPQEGKILIDGMDISQYDIRQIRQDMSIVLQDNILFTGTLKDNITLFDDLISDKRVIKSLLEVGGQDLLDGLEEGIHTEITKAGDSFSSGEKQIISFARALVKDPKVLVLDEATSNIDSQTEAIIQEGIKTLSRGRTMIIIAHRLSTIRHVDQICVLDKGRIVERGRHEDLVAQGGIYKEMYQAQSQ